MSGAVGVEDLALRVEALEAEVALLRGKISGGETSRVEVDSGGSSWDFAGRFVRLGERYGDLLRAEWWFVRGGVVLLLLGLAFLFKLSVDEGWITPLIRVMFGLGVGAVLVGFGVRIHPRRAVVGQAMIGGGVAAWYVSGFAAYTLYSLVPLSVAFGFMVAVSALAFSLSIRQDAASLAVIGAVGGLVTPFLFYGGGAAISWHVLYTTLILGAAAAVYLYRGWRVLLVPAAVGAWLSLLFTRDVFWMTEGMFSWVAVSSGIAFCWFAVWGAPVLRAMLLRTRRASRPAPLAYITGVSLLNVSFVWLFMISIEFSLRESGFGISAVALGCAVVVWILRRRRILRDERISYAQFSGAVVVGTVGLAVALPAWVFFIVLGAISAALTFFAARRPDPFVRVAGHAYFGILALWFFGAMAWYSPLGSFYDLPNTMLFATLIGIAVSLVAAVRLLDGKMRLIYCVGVHAAFMVWLLTVLSSLPNGGMFTTIAWGVYGSALLVASLRTDGGVTFNLAVATLLLVVGKLFIVDLFWVEAILRVLLFIGFGGLFVTLGYAVRSLWRPSADTSKPRA